MKKRNLVIGLLVMLAVIVSGFTFAFWASLDLTETESTSITIGSGRTITTTADLAAFDVSLVPDGQVNNSNQDNAASSVTLTYTLNYTDTAEYANTTTYTVDIINKLFAGLTETRINELFTFVVTADGSITKGSPETITIVVTFIAKPTEAEYATVANGTLSFDVVFTTVQTLNP